MQHFLFILNVWHFHKNNLKINKILSIFLIIFLHFTKTFLKVANNFLKFLNNICKFSKIIFNFSSIGMGRPGTKWPLDSDVIWQHLTICSDESSIVWPKSTYSYYKQQWVMITWSARDCHVIMFIYIYKYKYKYKYIYIYKWHNLVTQRWRLQKFY